MGAIFNPAADKMFYASINNGAYLNEKLINIRETFDQYNLISALHSFLSVKNDKFKNVLPPLVLLSNDKQKELIDKFCLLYTSDAADE